jgi:hypothetical protein
MPRLQWLRYSETIVLRLAWLCGQPFSLLERRGLFTRPESISCADSSHCLRGGVHTVNVWSFSTQRSVSHRR